MSRFLQKFARLAVIAGAVSAGALARADSLLYWMVADPLDSTSGLTVEGLKYVQDMAKEDQYAVARVAVYGSDGNRLVDGSGNDVYLNVWGAAGDEQSNFGIVLPDTEGSWVTTNPTYADVSAYAGTDASYSFMIEIGIRDADTDAWLVLAISELASYSELYEAGHIRTGSQEAPEHGPWTGGTWAVPEPGSGLLFLVGAGLLALRRRRRRA